MSMRCHCDKSGNEIINMKNEWEQNRPDQTGPGNTRPELSWMEQNTAEPTRSEQCISYRYSNSNRSNTNNNHIIEILCKHHRHRRRTCLTSTISFNTLAAKLLIKSYHNCTIHKLTWTHHLAHRIKTTTTPTTTTTAPNQQQKSKRNETQSNKLKTRCVCMYVYKQHIENVVKVPQT